jgi:hypothetical protein
MLHHHSTDHTAYLQKNSASSLNPVQCNNSSYQNNTTAHYIKKKHVLFVSSSTVWITLSYGACNIVKKRVAPSPGLTIKPMFHIIIRFG